MKIFKPRTCLSGIPVLVVLTLAGVIFLSGCDQLLNRVPNPDAISTTPREQIQDKPQISLDVELQDPSVDEDTMPWYELYFTSPTAYDDIQYDQRTIADGLIKAIDNAENTLDIAIFIIDLEVLGDAILNAVDRGVNVRMVVDSDSVEEDEMANRLREQNVSIVEDSREGFMHNKFVVIDAAYVWTGSWNFTFAGTYLNDNNAILIHSSQLALNYTNEFEEMYLAGSFGPLSPMNTSFPQVQIEDTLIINCFSPDDGCAGVLMDILSNAEKSIYFMAFSFTNDGFGDVIEERAEAGIDVRGVFEKRGSTTRYSEYARMRAGDLDVWQDGNGYAMHHKVFIVDEKIVIMGSYNFSFSAEEVNDENVLVIHNEEIAGQYVEEFEDVYALAVTKTFEE